MNPKFWAPHTQQFNLSGTGAVAEVVTFDATMLLGEIYRPSRITIEVVSGTLPATDVLYLADDDEVAPEPVPSASNIRWAGLASGTAPVIFDQEYGPDYASWDVRTRDAAQWRYSTSAVGAWEIKVTATFDRFHP